ncbi:MAG: c-type cytochrome [Bacteroidota bacterium]
MRKYSIPVLFITALYLVFGCVQSKERVEEDTSLYEYGETLFQGSGCVLCHSIAGEEMYGPSLDSILNQEKTVYRNGTAQVLTIDKAYILRAIKNPDYEKREGYQSKKMPKTTLNEEQIEAIAEYLIHLNL